MQQMWSFNMLSDSLPTKEHSHSDETTSSNGTQTAVQADTQGDLQSTSQDAPSTQQFQPMRQTAASTISRSGHPIKSIQGKSTHDALMAALAKSPFKSAQTSTPAINISPATGSHSTRSIASAAASCNIWINASRPQPASGRNVTIAEVRSVLSSVDVSTTTCTNPRKRLTTDMARLCRVCWLLFVEAAIGHCGHLLCTECMIEEALRERRCPLCKAALNAVELRVIMGVRGATGEDAELGYGGTMEPTERASH